jgi:hypothetical protein
MVVPLFASLYGINLAHNSMGNLYGVNQARMGLANAVTGMESPAQIAQLHSSDRALELQGAMAKVNYQVALAMQEAAQKLLKQHEEQRRRLMQAGATLV